jgi:predicted Fe-S protein YdhL (DUF1289 family)
MKTFCFGCKRIRQLDGSWEKGEFDYNEDSSTQCPECTVKNRAAMEAYKQKKCLQNNSNQS